MNSDYSRVSQRNMVGLTRSSSAANNTVHTLTTPDTPDIPSQASSSHLRYGGLRILFLFVNFSSKFCQVRRLTNVLGASSLSLCLDSGAFGFRFRFINWEKMN